METKINPQPPHAQCCVGFETDVDILDKVCHHCGRAICKNHESIPILGEPLLPNPEYRYLGLLGAEQQSVVHCHECAKVPSGWLNLWRKFFRLLGALLGIDWIQKRWYLGHYRPVAPLTPDVAGIAFEEKMDGKITLGADGVYAAKATPPTGKLTINFRFLARERLGWETYCRRYGVKKDDLSESFHAGFGLLKDSNHINPTGLPADAIFFKTGALEFKGTLNQVNFFTSPKSESVTSLSRADEQLTVAPEAITAGTPQATEPSPQVTIGQTGIGNASLGVLPLPNFDATVAEGSSISPTPVPSAVEQATATQLQPATPSTLASPMPSLADKPKPAQPQSMPKNVWPVKFDYAIVRSDDKEIPLPIRLTPTIIHGDQGCSLELTLQLNLDTGTSPDLTSLRIEEVSIEAPSAVGQVIGMDRSTMVSKLQRDGSAQAKVTITWQGGLELTKERPQASVRVRYAEPLDNTMSIEGKIKASGSGTLSGLKDVQLFYPWGPKRSTRPKSNRRTTVTADFVLSLASLRFQDPVTRTESYEYTGLILDTPLLETLTKNLDAASLYVKRVVENPAYPSRANTQLVNRFWDVAGRAYIDVYTIDFHLLLTGEHYTISGRDNGLGFDPMFAGTAQTTTIRPNQNRIKVMATLQGVAINSAMQQQVERVFENLHSVLDNTFN